MPLIRLSLVTLVFAGNLRCSQLRPPPVAPIKPEGRANESDPTS
jgi:hypothetical protein